MSEAHFMALAQKRYRKLQALNKIDNLYNYEKEFEKIWRDLGKSVLETNIKNKIMKAKRRCLLLIITPPMLTVWIIKPIKV